MSSVSHLFNTWWSKLGSLFAGGLEAFTFGGVLHGWFDCHNHSTLGQGVQLACCGITTHVTGG
jgi:hypothetical protein